MAGDFEGQASDFWGFALALYDKFPDAFNDLQDRAGRDVNLLLLCLWTGMERGLALVAGDFPELDAALEPWRSRVVEPLRAVRRHLRGDSLAVPLREKVKDAEIDAERVAQRRLLAALPDRPLDAPSLALGLANLGHYAGPDVALSFSVLFVADADPRPSA